MFREIFLQFCKIQNNFVKISCFAKFWQCCFAATLCRSGVRGGGRPVQPWLTLHANADSVIYNSALLAKGTFGCVFLIFNLFYIVCREIESSFFKEKKAAVFDAAYDQAGIKKMYTFIHWIEFLRESFLDLCCLGEKI